MTKLTLFDLPKELIYKIFDYYDILYESIPDNFTNKNCLYYNIMYVINNNLLIRLVNNYIKSCEKQFPIKFAHRDLYPHLQYYNISPKYKNCECELYSHVKKCIICKKNICRYCGIAFKRFMIYFCPTYMYDKNDLFIIHKECFKIEKDKCIKYKKISQKTLQSYNCDSCEDMHFNYLIYKKYIPYMIIRYEDGYDRCLLCNKFICGICREQNGPNYIIQNRLNCTPKKRRSDVDLSVLHQKCIKIIDNKCNLCEYIKENKIQSYHKCIICKKSTCLGCYKKKYYGIQKYSNKFKCRYIHLKCEPSVKCSVKCLDYKYRCEQCDEPICEHLIEYQDNDMYFCKKCTDM